jgi:broad specificity phosphatase PhoE
MSTQTPFKSSTVLAHNATTIPNRKKLLRNAQKSPLLAMEIDEDVAEFDYGGFEGLTTQQILERNPDWDMWRDGYDSPVLTDLVKRL